MSDPRTALMSAIYGRLVGDDDLVALLGGPSVYDRVPRAARHPFVVFASFESETADGDEPPATEHEIRIDVLSRGYGRREASQIADRVRTLLHDAPLALVGHRLGHCLHRTTRLGPARDRRSFRASLSFRALTEPD